MKIICIGRNYADHIAELQNEKPAEPVLFLKPDTALLRPGEPFFIPSFSQEVHYELELVLKISREGKHVERRFAERYFEEVGLGIDFTARDVQNELKSKGLPWEKAKAFNHSAPVGSFVPKTSLGALSDLRFHLEVNGELRQQGHSALMLFDFAQIIEQASRYFTLKKGDLLFTGTPAGVARVQPGDRLRGFLGQQCLLDLEIR